MAPVAPRLVRFALWLSIVLALGGIGCDADEPVANPSGGGSGGSIVGSGGSGGTAGAGGSIATGATGGTGGSAAAGGTGGTNGNGGFATICSACHGNTENPAPPKDTQGRLGTSYSTVGAHQAHVIPASWHRTGRCEHCHPVPTSPMFDPDFPTHQNGQPDIVFTGIAEQSSYHDTTYQCTNVYCHGASLQPDILGTPTVRIPQWTTVDGSQKACGAACHSLPPGGTHDSAEQCQDCHGQVISWFNSTDPAASLFAEADLHVNGTVEHSGGAGHGGSGGYGGSGGHAGNGGCVAAGGTS